MGASQAIYEVAVVGGGASGLVAAVAAARTLRETGTGPGEVAVVVFEGDERVGRSILATGNGRCNVSNARIDPSAYRNGDFVAQALAALEEAMPAEPRDAAPSQAPASNAVMRFFASCGLSWREEGQGRLYPSTGKASTVLDVLRAAARASGVAERCGNGVRAVEPPREPGGRFTLRMADGAFERARAVVLAVGGRDGLSLLPGDVAALPLSPVLGPLRTEARPIRALDNIRVRCSVALRRGGPEGRLVASERGEVLFRKYGVSGIAVFNLSRFAEPGDCLVIDLLAGAGAPGVGWLAGAPGDVAGGIAGAPGAGAPGDVAGGIAGATPAGVGADAGATPAGAGAGLGATPAGAPERAAPEGGRPSACAPEKAEGLLLRRRDALAAHGMAATCGDVLRGLLLPLVAEAVCAAAGIDPDGAPTDGALRRLARTASGFALRVEGIGDARSCQVRRGGVDVAALDPATMAVRAVPGLFAAGEAVDVDAPCGGFNLHWAWASGLLAGRAAADAASRA